MVEIGYTVTQWASLWNDTGSGGLQEMCVYIFYLYGVCTVHVLTGHWLLHRRLCFLGKNPWGNVNGEEKSGGGCHSLTAWV